MVKKNNKRKKRKSNSPRQNSIIQNVGIGSLMERGKKMSSNKTIMQKMEFDI